ncbi:hypothetical protein F4779DRAFT_643313 [Xylariaceae sp. FL0662B]|nr:hypothetical protein F4779DRAFT_643313 [Xylariaceae sp. FL0662B]
MPFLLADAPEGLPDAETIEGLLAEPNDENRVKTLQELSPKERAQTNLVSLEKRCDAIPGDPFGILPSWAGNVGHMMDERMVSTIRTKYSISDNETVRSIRHLLDLVRTTDVEELAKESAVGHEAKVLVKSEEETTVTFMLNDAISVRIMHCHDLDKNVKDSYHQSDRARKAAACAKSLFDETKMPIDVQKRVMARLLSERVKKTSDLDKLTRQKKYFPNLRADARQYYWLELESKEQRKTCEDNSLREETAELAPYLTAVEENWQRCWDNGAKDPDFFQQYLADKIAAEKVWDLVDQDLLIVADKHRRVVFASLERATQLLFGQQLADDMAYCLDLWSFFCPMPLPETGRHQIDRWIRKIHPELDPASASVVGTYYKALGLCNAKMAISHYGCWSQKGDPKGQRVQLSADARFARTIDLSYLHSLFPGLCESVFARVSDGTYMMQGLEPDYYQECRDIWDQLPEREKLKTGKDDFLSLFVLGVNPYTQRHRDTKDVFGGLTGLLTLGQYRGGNLCLPQLGIKVPYGPGSCALIRGDALEHLVQDFSGPRFFTVGTNHESCRQFALRKLGKVEPLPPDYGSRKRRRATEDEQGDVVCAHQGSDEDDEIEWTNQKIHGPAALVDDG